MKRLLYILALLLSTQTHAQDYLARLIPIVQSAATPVILIDSVSQSPATGNASTVTTISRPKNMTGANTITVEVSSYRLIGTYGDTVIDNLNNLYVRDTFIRVGTDQPRGTMWRCTSPVTSGSMYWTFTSPSVTLPTISVQGWGGVTSGKDKIAGNLGGGTVTSLSTNSVTPSASGALIIVFGTGLSATGLPTVSGSGWNLLYSQTFMSSNRLQHGVWYQIQSVAAPINTVVTFGAGNNNPVTMIEALR